MVYLSAHGMELTVSTTPPDTVLMAALCFLPGIDPMWRSSRYSLCNSLGKSARLTPIRRAYGIPHDRLPLHTPEQSKISIEQLPGTSAYPTGIGPPAQQCLPKSISRRSTSMHQMGPRMSGILYTLMPSTHYHPVQTFPLLEAP